MKKLSLLFASIGLLFGLVACANAATPVNVASSPKVNEPAATNPAPTPAASKPSPAAAAAPVTAPVPATVQAPGPAPAAPVAVAPAPVSPTSGFTVKNLSMNPEACVAGDNVTVSVEVTNGGKTRGTYTVVLKFDGDVMKTQDVTLDSGSTKRVDLVVTPNVVGMYQVTIEQLSTKFEVAACPV